MTTTAPAEDMRLDKWLWAARFFKTRGDAAEAVSGGRVHVNGQRAKPGKDIRVGSRLQIQRDGLEWDVEVLALPRQRRPAAEAATFYRESDASVARRDQQLAERRALHAAASTPPPGRPDKHGRRLLRRIREQRD
jgi:ribosome-associated heat shock protein Hsp15